MTVQGNFHLGQVVQHRLYGYRGVIVDVDSEFKLTDDWYMQVAKSKPLRNRPWFKILVHNTEYETYEAEENLRAEEHPDKINHPDLKDHFCGYSKGAYVTSIPIN